VTEALTIRCRCGEVVHGEDEQTLLAAARRHVEADHPELAGRLSDEDLLAMASAV
jgi:hypothetical protein